MVWVTGVVVIDNMIHNLSIDSHIFVSNLNATTEMEEERGTHDMCAVCSLSSSPHRHHHHHDDDNDDDDDDQYRSSDNEDDDDDDQYR